MVLLTAINNLRHYQGKKSKGCLDKLSSVDSGSEGPCYPVTFDVPQIMEIEKYYAAFPALGKTISSSCGDQVQIAGQAVQHLPSTTSADTCVTTRKGYDINSNGSTKVKHPPSHYHTPPRSPHFTQRSKSGHINHYKEGLNNGKKNINIVKTLPHSSSPKSTRNNARKTDHKTRADRDHRRTKHVKVKESKPWKHLPDLKHQQQPPVKAPQPDAPKDKPSEQFISDDLLEAILTSNSESNSSVDNTADDGLRSLWGGSYPDTETNHLGRWSYPKLGSSFIDSENACLGTDESSPVSIENNENIASEQASKNWNSDYAMIEQSLASLQFCEDISTEVKGSRMMPLFRENPFSYMIQHGSLSSSNTDTYPDPKSFTCRHCEETYEVVLEAESSVSRFRPLPSSVACHIDSRLDFDWTKYQPPPWSDHGIEEMTHPPCNQPSIDCDCEFCRSRIWKRTCKLCCTPLNP